MTGRMANPFNPQFGKRPEQFIGRELIVNNILQALKEKDSPLRTSIITGIRGSGKTAILSDLRESIDTNNYLIIDITAHDGMLLEILDECVRSGKTKNRFSSGLDDIQGFSAGALGFTVGLSKRDDNTIHGFRYALSEILDKLRDKKIGTVFLIDEVQNETPEIREFVITYQHLVREGYDVSLVMAGLPSSVNDVLNDSVLTFLRRAHRLELENLDIKAVEIAYNEAFTHTKRSFVGDALAQMAGATKGYPYLVQLLGFYVFDSGQDEIDEALVKKALALSKIELFKNVHDMLFQELSARDRDFLFAMVKDGDPSKFANIREQLGVTPGYASKYRERLLVFGMVKAAGYGKLTFAPPYMREYLQTKIVD